VSAVGYCHKNGVCHRDLKPENLILDEEGNIKINGIDLFFLFVSFSYTYLDFGLSNFFAADTLLNSFCGSPIYASPEIMAEKNYNGPAADVWSLGIVLYAMVVGQLPWKLDERGIICDVDDLIRARFTIPASATISAECEDLIRRILVADPQSRLKLDDVARHPWILKGFGYPVSFNGEVLPLPFLRVYSLLSFLFLYYVTGDSVKLENT
jgi:serine/threonine-protein kinase SIK3